MRLSGIAENAMITTDWQRKERRKMSIFCVGQSSYDITIPLEGPLIENQKYRITTPFPFGKI